MVTFGAEDCVELLFCHSGIGKRIDEGIGSIGRIDNGIDIDNNLSIPTPKINLHKCTRTLVQRHAHTGAKTQTRAMTRTHTHGCKDRQTYTVCHR